VRPCLCRGSVTAVTTSCRVRTRESRDHGKANEAAGGDGALARTLEGQGQGRRRGAVRSFSPCQGPDHTPDGVRTASESGIKRPGLGPRSGFGC